MTARHLPLHLATITAAGLLLAACAPAAEESAGPEELRITMTEFAFDPAELSLPSGEVVVLVLVNDGAVPHEFMAGREPMPDDGGYMQDFFDGVTPTVTPTAAVGTDAHDAHTGFMVMVDPGETVEVSFTVPDDRQGEWEIGCFEPGHYEAGMHATLTVPG